MNAARRGISVNTTGSKMHKVERALFELRRGRALYVTSSNPSASALVAAAEGLPDETLAQLRALCGDVRLVVTHHRGQAIGLTVQHTGSPPNLSLGLNTEATPTRVLGLSTASAARLDTGAPEWRDVRKASEAEDAGLQLMRLGRLIPAVVTAPLNACNAQVLEQMIADGTILSLDSEGIEEVVGTPGIEVTHVTEAAVPLADAEHARFVFFRETSGFLEHVAVLIGTQEEWPDPVPVRLHSACLTGDLFGSLKCDCGDQLRGALRHFAEQGGGVLVYLAQEGRGIGLGNKIRAYALQQEGLDTIDADGTLGFGADERQFDSAVRILKHLKINRVQLLTNNPEKVKAVEAGGIEVVERVALHGTLNRHNLRYVTAKVNRAGHWLVDMLSQKVE